MPPLDWVLYCRYFWPPAEQGSNNYGDEKSGSNCNTRNEKAPVGSQIDVSRNTYDYFSNDTNVFLGEISSGTEESSNINKQAVNRAVNFMGKDYVLIGDGIYVYNDDTLTWDLSQIATGKTPASTSCLGLYPAYFNDAPHLTTAWSVSDTSTWFYAIMNGNTNVWAIGSFGAGGNGLAPDDSEGGILTEIQHKDRIYYLTSASGEIGFYNYRTKTGGTFSISQESRHPMDFCSFQNNLYLINHDGSDDIQILQVKPSGLEDGGSTKFQVNLTTAEASDIGGVFVGESINNNNDFEGRPLIFVDNIYDSGNVDGLHPGGPGPTMWTYYVAAAETAGWDDMTESTNQTNHGLRAVPFRLDENGDLVDVSATNMVTGFRSKPFRLGQDQEESHNSDNFLLEILGLDEYKQRKDEKMVLRVFMDQKERGSDGTGKSAIVVSTRFSGQKCDNRSHGGGDFTNLLYHAFRGSGNVDGGSHPTAPSKNGPHSFEFLGLPAKEARHRGAPHGMLGGGSRHSEVDNNGNRLADIVFRGAIPTKVDGELRVSYSIIPSSGNPEGNSVDTVRWWYDNNHHAPETPCIITATSHGSISGIEIKNIIVASGTTYWFEWNAKAAGIRRNDYFPLVGQLTLNPPVPLVIDDPTDISSLEGWWNGNNADMIIDMDGLVSSWTDYASGIFLVQSDLTKQPVFLPRGVGEPPGVGFIDDSPGDFLFASGSPIDGSPCTVFMIYEPSGITGGRDTMWSLSNDHPASGAITAHEYYSVTLSGVSEPYDMGLEDLDTGSTFSGKGTRNLTLPSGGEASKIRFAVWRNISFESAGQLFPGGHPEFETNVEVDGSIEPTGLGNITFGRFTGSLDVWTTPPSGTYLGAGDYFNGIIFEVGFYSRALANIEIDRLRVYAEDKYNLDI